MIDLQSASTSKSLIRICFGAFLTPLLLFTVTGAMSSVFAARDPERYLGFDPPGLAPEVFAPGLVSRDSDDCGAVIRPDGKEILFFTVRRVGNRGVSTIYVTELRNGAWTEPEIAPFSGTYSDGYVSMHPDGSRLFFQSDRPIDREESEFEYNIWFVEREGEGWSGARPIGRPINGPNHTGGPSVTMDGTLYYTVMDLESGESKIYRSRLERGAYQEPERLPDPVNRRFQTSDSYVAPDGNYLIFTAFEKQGHRDNPGAVYISFLDADGGWTEARKMGPEINSGDLPGSVTISPDGRYLLFARDNSSAGTGRDVYWVDSRIVGKSKN